MKDGWPAKGLLKPLWLAHGGRQALATDAGVSEGHMSKVNAGKANLGIDAATKIARARGVSVLELGAPLEQADNSGETLLTRLRSLETAVAEAVELMREALTLLRESRRQAGEAR